jgi:quercetin dioxygenase-like cupin family protein
VTEEVLERRGTVLVRRQRLAPGESTPWHLDPHHRVTVVLSGEVLAIEYPDRAVAKQFPVTPGQVDWDAPFDRVHRATNVGKEPYEEVAVFFLDSPDSDPQPRADVPPQWTIS